MSEFILPYEAVRLSSTPEADLRALVSTYDAAATLAAWDRAAFERPRTAPPRATP